MLHIKLRIQDYSDKDNPIFPEYSGIPILHHGLIQSVGILEGGMTSGKPSVSFLALTEDDKLIYLETSGEILEGIYHALQGAKQRWAIKPHICKLCGGELEILDTIRYDPEGIRHDRRCTKCRTLWGTSKDGFHILKDIPDEP